MRRAYDMGPALGYNISFHPSSNGRSTSRTMCDVSNNSNNKRARSESESETAAPTPVPAAAKKPRTAAAKPRAAAKPKTMPAVVMSNTCAQISGRVLAPTGAAVVVHAALLNEAMKMHKVADGKGGFRFFVALRSTQNDTFDLEVFPGMRITRDMKDCGVSYVEIKPIAQEMMLPVAVMAAAAASS